MTPETWIETEPHDPRDPLHCAACARDVDWIVCIGPSRLSPSAALCQECVARLWHELGAETLRRVSR